MDYEQLKREVREIASIAESLPAPFREKCFELLLVELLRGAAPPTEASTERGSGNDGGTGDSVTLKPSGPIRVFMQRTGTDLGQLERVLTQEDGEVQFLREPSDSTISGGQIAWTLLLALKNGFDSKTLSADGGRPVDVPGKGVLR